MKTMTMSELSEFLGKSNKTIHRYAKECGVVAVNGRLTRLNESQVKNITERVFKRVPLAVQISIRDTFSNVQGVPATNEKVESEYVKRGMDLVFGAIGKLDERLSKIESCIEEKQLLLPAPPMKPRDHINKLVREYSHAKGITFTEAWSRLYREFGYRTNTNPTLSAKNRGMTIIDYIESEGQIDTLESVAVEIYSTEVTQ